MQTQRHHIFERGDRYSGRQVQNTLINEKRLQVDTDAIALVIRLLVQIQGNLLIILLDPHSPVSQAVNLFLCLNPAFKLNKQWDIIVRWRTSPSKC